MATTNLMQGTQNHADINTRLRTLAHDLSNSIETIMQASYLLAQTQLDDNGKKWLELIDNATRDAARINRDIRELLRTQTAMIAREAGQPVK